MKKMRVLIGLAALTAVAFGCERCNEWSVEKEDAAVERVSIALKAADSKPNYDLLKSELRTQINCRKKNEDENVAKGGNSMALYYLGKMESWEPSERKEGIAHLRDALTLSPNDTDIQLALANGLLWEGIAAHNEGMIKESEELYQGLKKQRLDTESRKSVENGLAAIDEVRKSSAAPAAI